MIQNKYHLQILTSIKKVSKSSLPDFEGFGLKYVGSNKPSYHLNTAEQKQVIKEFLRHHKLTAENYFDLITSLYVLGESYDEIIIAGRLVGSCPYRSKLNPKLLDTWLSFVHGWAETDTLCQMAFTDTDLLNRWSEWEKLLFKFKNDQNIHKRRASLVLLTKPLRLSADTRLSNLAFTNVELLKTEKDILITKALSWILRSLIKHHSTQVAEYIKSNQSSLPRVAIREVTSKLLTGKKYINSKKYEKSTRRI